MKFKISILLFCVHAYVQTAERKSPETDTPALTDTPYSPIRQNTSALELSLAKSEDRLTPIFEISYSNNNLQEELHITQRNHQKLFQRLQKDKQNFFNDQERERENTTFSRWEKLTKKPQNFNLEQTSQCNQFLHEIEKTLIKSQQEELRVLEEFLNNPISKKINTPKAQKKLIEELTSTKNRHVLEKDMLKQIPDKSYREKLLSFWEQKPTKK